MSRSAAILTALLGMVSAPAPAQTSVVIDRYRSVTSVEPHCGRPTDSREILVCGLRRADRWRVPFIGYDAGDPRGEGVSAERNRLAAAPKAPCGQGAIIADCGSMVGVKASVGFGASGTETRLRPLAP